MSVTDSSLPQTARHAAEFRMPACPSCGATEHAIITDREGVTWTRCRCDLIYKLHEVEREWGEPEGDDYFASGGAGGHAYDRRRRRRVAKSRRQVLDVLNHVPPGRLLDVGCSLGYTLEAARDLGMDSLGVDVRDFAVEECRRLGFDAEVGSMESIPAADGSFDVVVLKHVLEHASEPRAVLTELARVLRPGGGLFIAVPHARYHKAVRHPDTYRAFGAADQGPSEHFVFYTPETLSALLRSLGWRVVQVGPSARHRRASAAARFGQLLTAPARIVIRRMRDGLGLDKEFSLVATK